MEAPVDATESRYVRNATNVAIYTIGLISIDYAKFEFALSGVLANVAGMTRDFTTILFPKISNDVRFRLVEEQLTVLAWPIELKDCVAHFIQCGRIVVENRNFVMHSELTADETRREILFYKQNKRGLTQSLTVTLETLKSVPREIMTVTSFGNSVG
jgi:hypothetical protein